MLHIVVPMAGKGSRFADAGYAFPKPLIDIEDKTMIEVVINNLRPETEHKFIFICQKEHYLKYDLYNILKRASRDKFEVIQIDGVTEGAACTVLLASQFINTDDELIIANSDQYVSTNINDFVDTARSEHRDGLIMTFEASHPKWSYARIDDQGKVMEVAEKRIISSHATVGIYYYKKGSDFVSAAQMMIQKDIRHNGEFYVCPVYNELLLADKNIGIYEVRSSDMHGLGTPEDLTLFLEKLKEGSVRL